MDKFNPNSTRYVQMVNRMLKIFFHEKKANCPLDMASIRQILIIGPMLIGDIVMLIPFLRVLKREAPESRITLACGPWAVPVLDGQGLVDHFVLVDCKALNSPNGRGMAVRAGRLRRALKEINEVRYDVALEPKGDLRYIFFMHFCKAERKISYSYTGGECLLTDVIEPSEGDRHLLEDEMSFARGLGCSFTEEDMYPVLRLTDIQKKKNEEYIRLHCLEGKTLIGVHPGASREHKRWKGFGGLVVALDVPNAVFLVFSGPGEEGMAEEIVRTGWLSGRECMHVHERLEDYVRLLAICHVCICNDSGCGHLTAAHGRPVVVVFGPYEPEFGRPYSKRTYTVSHNLGCKPCMSGVCLTGKFECLERISVEEVKDAVKKALGETEGSIGYEVY